MWVLYNVGVLPDTRINAMYEGKLLRDKLTEGTNCLGIFNTSSDPCITELLAGAGYDFIIIDAEHGALNIESVQANIMATMNSDCVPLVRVPDRGASYIKAVLDAGAGGVVVPQVRGAEDVEAAVSACLYPPAGTRGFGPRRPANYERNYAEVAETANDHIVIWAQIEDMGAVDEIEAIVSIPNLTGVIIGPNDLAASLGLIFQKEHPTVLEAIEKVRRAAHDAALPAGMAGTSDPEGALAWLKEGFQFATLSNTNGLLMRASRDFLSRVREGLG